MIGRLVPDDHLGISIVGADQIDFGPVGPNTRATATTLITVQIDRNLFRAGTEFRWIVFGEGQVTLQPGTKVLDAETCAVLESIDPESGTLVFSEGTDVLDDLAPGDVVTTPATGNPEEMLADGFIGTVDTVSVDEDGNVTVETSEAGLTDAVADVDFGMTIIGQTLGELGGPVNIPEADPDDPLTRNEGGCLVQEAGETTSANGQVATTSSGTGGLVTCDFGFATHNGIAEPIGPIEIVDGLTLHGSMRVQGPDLGMNLRMRGGAVEFFKFDIVAEQALTLVLIADVEEEFEQTNPLFELILAQYTMNVGPVPITFILRLDAEAVTAGYFNGKGKISFVEQAEFVAGFKFEDEAWDSNVIANVDARLSDPEIRELDAGVEARLRPRIELDINLVGGPYVEGEAFVTFDADALADPLWTVRAGTEIYAGVTVNPLGIELVQERTRLLRRERELSGANPLPTSQEPAGGLPVAAGGIGLEPLEAGEEIRWSKVYPLGGTDTALDLSPGEDGRSVLSGEGFGGRGVVLEIDRFGDIQWQRQLGFLHALRASTSFAGSDAVIAGQRGGDLFVARLDSDGELVWTRQFALPASISELDLVEVGDPGAPDVLVVGTLFDLGSAERDGLVVRIGGDGELQWARRYGQPGTDEVLRFGTRLANGLVAVGGDTNDTLPVPASCDGVSVPIPSGYGLLLMEDGTVVDAQTIGSAFILTQLYAATDDGGTGGVQWAGARRFTPLDDSPSQFFPPYTVGPVGADLLSEIRGIAAIPGGVVGAGAYGAFGEQTASLFRFATHPRADATEDFVGPGTGGIWWMDFGGSGSDRFEAVNPAGDGFLALGDSDSFSLDRDLWLVRTGEDGFVPFREDTGGSASFGSLFEKRTNSRLIGQECIAGSARTQSHPTTATDLTLTEVTALPITLTDPGIVPVELVRDPEVLAPLPAPGTACGFGFELALVLPALRALRRRRA